MKHTWKYLVVSAVCFAILPFSAPAQQGEVYSLNVVGFQKMGYESGLEIKSNPFEGMTLREVAGNDGKYTTTSDPADADNLLVFDAANQQYIRYYLRSHSSIGRPEWRIGTQWATNVYLYPGQAYFYRSRLGIVRTNVVAGDVVLASAVTNTVRPGLQLFSYPFAARVLMSDIDLKNGKYTTTSDPADADNILKFDSASQQYLRYYLRSHSSIGRPEWRIGTVWATNVYVEPGEGFWFRSRVGNPYQWIEETPYPNL